MLLLTITVSALKAVALTPGPQLAAATMYSSTSTVVLIHTQLSASQAHAAGLEVALDGRCRELGALHEQNTSSLAAELAASHAEVCAQHEARALAEGQRAAFEEEAGMLREQVQNMEGALAAAREEAQSSSSLVKGLQVEMAAAREGAENSSSSRVQSLEAKLKAAREGAESNSSRVQSLEAELAGAREGAESNSSRVQSLEAELEGATEAKEQLLGRAREEAARLQSQVDAAQVSAAAHSRRVCELEAQLLASEDQGQELTRQVAECGVGLAAAVAAASASHQEQLAKAMEVLECERDLHRAAQVSEALAVILMGNEEKRVTLALIAASRQHGPPHGSPALLPSPRRGVPVWGSLTPPSGRDAPPQRQINNQK